MTGHEAWRLDKPAVSAHGGLVASQHYRASAIGAEVLAAGGNAVDAAVTTSFALGVLEPWMSGLGGGGLMRGHEAATRRTWGVDANMVAPQALDPADYPLTGGRAGDLFGWPAVKEDRNLRGHASMAVPGLVAGLALALERFGSWRWSDCLGPSIELAARGLEVDWYATLKIAAAARHLARYPESRRIYLPGGFPPAAEWGGPPPVIRLGRLGSTLERLAYAGPGDFYTGELSRELLADLQENGSALGPDDLAGYRAVLGAAGQQAYRDAWVHYAPGLSAGPSLARSLELLQQHPPEPWPGPDTYQGYATVLRQAYAERLTAMGDGEPDSCTTHIGVVDRHGNLVALTQTLLSVFGSKAVLPRTGVLMNNGIMWFDPRPGRPNSIAAGRRPLANMCPALVQRGDGLRAALGASGGRRILPAVLQLVSFLVDHRMDLDQA
ncbi:MAG: gamma-glutamyltransferase, partial [Candidatus Competibacterales bacterium]|nr:gamma-glutamyltransferase [Candidatus Competibacterales bacterium]